MNAAFKILMILGSLLSVLAIKTYYPSYKDDNVIEESVEQIIKYETDIDIDLTPMSPEEK